jgi:hypothetical protein
MNSFKKNYYSSVIVNYISSHNPYSLFYFLVFSLHKDFYSVLQLSNLKISYYINNNSSNKFKKNKVYIISINKKENSFSLPQIVHELNMINKSNDLNINVCLSFNDVLYHSNYYSNKIDFFYEKSISFFSITVFILKQNIIYFLLALKTRHSFQLIHYLVSIKFINIVFVNRFLFL